MRIFAIFYASSIHFFIKSVAMFTDILLWNRVPTAGSWPELLGMIPLALCSRRDLFRLKWWPTSKGSQGGNPKNCWYLHVTLLSSLSYYMFLFYLFLFQVEKMYTITSTTILMVIRPIISSLWKGLCLWFAGRDLLHKLASRYMELPGLNICSCAFSVLNA